MSATSVYVWAGAKIQATSSGTSRDTSSASDNSSALADMSKEEREVITPPRSLFFCDLAVDYRISFRLSMHFEQFPDHSAGLAEGSGKVGLTTSSQPGVTEATDGASKKLARNGHGGAQDEELDEESSFSSSSAFRGLPAGVARR